MFRFSLLIIFILIPVVLSASNSYPDSSTVADSLVSEIRVYEVFGMDCPGCHGAVENLVIKVPAVKSAEANWEKQILKVVINPHSGVKDEDIFDAIMRANFTPGKRIE